MPALMHTHIFRAKASSIAHGVKKKKSLGIAEAEVSVRTSQSIEKKKETKTREYIFPTNHTETPPQVPDRYEHPAPRVSGVESHT